uniref:tRNA wybutosine-synthesizing protein 3 homolog n=1 Tax=Cyclopterus lumpus TaxID=8103 RepID=A0A8C3A9E5_CYCLU
MAMEKTFRQWKKQCLNKLDPSKKGSVDEDIVHVVSLLNSCEEYFTTSSCSGRVMLIDGVRGDVHKQNCVWLFVSHRKCQSEDLVRCAGLPSRGDAVFKFEPFVLHVQCRRLEDAQLMHSVAIDSGFRNSGLTAVRSTHGLEVPLSHEGKLLVEQEYIHFLTRIANQKAEENQRRIHRSVSYSLIKQKEEEEKKTSVYKRRWKREQHHRADRRHGDRSSLVPDLDDCRHGDRSSLVPDLDDCRHGDRSSLVPDLDDCLDLFT